MEDPGFRQTLAELQELSRELDRFLALAPSGRTKYAAKARADAEKVRRKRAEMLEALLDRDIDSAKENAKADYDEAREQFLLAIRIIAEQTERQTQVVQKITS